MLYLSIPPSPSKILISGCIAAVLMTGGSVGAAEVYKFDQGHTEIGFGWNHAGVSMQHGEFLKADGTLSLDPEKVETSKISVTIDAASVSTGVQALDTHLKSSSFLDVQKHPSITFESTSVTKTGDKSADVTGDLTLHGVTKPVTLKVVLTHRGSHPVGQYIDHYKGSWVAFAAEAKINLYILPFGALPVDVSILSK